jgi:hypothetical protein
LQQVLSLRLRNYSEAWENPISPFLSSVKPP